MLNKLIESAARHGINAAADAADRKRKQKFRAIDDVASQPDHSLVIGETIPGLRERGKAPKPVSHPLERRKRHMLVTGKSGSGKSNLARLIAQWDIESGKIGLCCVDFRGETVDILLREIAAGMQPNTRAQVAERLLLLDIRESSIFSAPDEPIVGFNLLQSLGSDPYVCVAIFMDILSAIWGRETMGVRLSDQLRHSMLALCLSPSGPYALVDLETFLLDTDFRAQVLTGVEDEMVVSYFARYDNGKDRESEAEAVLNKLTLLLSTHRRLRAVLSVRESSFSLEEFLRTRRAPYILICADTSRAGKQVAGIVCALLLTAIVRAAMPSDVEPGKARPTPLHLILDEFINYAAACREPLDELVREGRKFNLFSTMITQSPGLLDSYTSSLAVNVVGNLAYFGAGPEDANAIAAMIASEDANKTILRTQLLQARPGEMLFLQEGTALQRVKVIEAKEPEVSDEAVRALRATALARWGTTLQKKVDCPAATPLPVAPIEAREVPDETGSKKTTGRRRKSS